VKQFLGLLALAACGDGLRGERVVAVAVVGTEGGTIEGEGIALEIPAGALGERTTITISTAETTLDESKVALSPVFRFEPDGLEFATPVAVRIAAPGADRGVVLWTEKNGRTFEWAGYVTAGVGYVEIMHFSEGVAADEFGACDADTESCVGGACAGLDDKCMGDTCPADPGPACTVEESPLEACRDICWCDSNDRFDHMCASNPGDPRISCPATNAEIGKILANGSFERDAQGNEFLARRNGDACSGYSIRPQVLPACFCIANAGPPANGANLCRNGRWVNKATPPNFNWACESDIEGKAPSLRNGLLFEDLATKSFTGTNGGTCTGQYINNNAPQTATGTLQSCVDTNVAHGYYQLPGTATSCGAFAWPDGNTPPTVSIDRATCRLSAADAAELARGRIVAKLRPRTDMPDDGATFALLKADMRTIPGINYTDRTNVIVPECQGQGVFTARHAEGDALESLALLRGVTPITEPPYGSTGGTRNGSARMLVDRAPCEKNCAAYGIDRMRKCAALDELVVDSPSGTVKYCDTCGAKGQKQ
jgi:hypothetical protein